MDQGRMEAVLREWRATRRPEALGELLKAQRHRAYAIALRMTCSEPEAEDAVQDAFIKLLTRTHGFEDVEAFELSVYRAVVQCSLDAVRKKRRRTVHEDAVRNQPAGETQVPDVQTHASAEQEEARALLRTAVKELPEDERAPVVLCYYQGMSVVQTAKTLELPRETVRARLAKAMERLRGHLRMNRNGKDMSAAIIVGLLWQDGAAQAPQSLCAALDQALPGKSCSEVAARASQFGPAHVSAVTKAAAWASPALLAPAALILVLSAAAAVYWPQTPRPAQAPAAQEPVKTVVETPAPLSTAAAANGAASPAAPRSQPGSVEVRKEDGPVKSKLTAAMVLVGATMLPVAAQAGEPSAQVGAIVAQIAARRAEKDAAAATAAQSNQYGERAGGWSTAPGQSNPGPGGAVNTIGRRNP